MSRGFIVDLDGTVYRGDDLVPGAVDAVGAIREASESLLFFSNNPTRDGTAYVEHLSALGVPVEADEACSAGGVTAKYLQNHHADDAVFLIGADGIADVLTDAGASLTDVPEAADVLLAGWSPTFDYDDMVDALRVHDDETPFFGTDPDRTFPGEDGEPTPGSGAIITAVAGVLETEPDRILGKPSREAQRFALDRLGVPAEECLVIGDRLSTDIALGERAGMETALVLTGATDRSDLDGSPITPDYVLDSIADVGRVLDD